MIGPRIAANRTKNTGIRDDAAGSVPHTRDASPEQMSTTCNHGIRGGFQAHVALKLRGMAFAGIMPSRWRGVRVMCRRHWLRWDMFAVGFAMRCSAAFDSARNLVVRRRLHAPKIIFGKSERTPENYSGAVKNATAASSRLVGKRFANANWSCCCSASADMTTTRTRNVTRRLRLHDHRSIVLT